MNTTSLHIPSNRVCDIERYIYEELSGLYPKEELRQFILMFFEAFLGWDQVRFLLNRQNTINQSDLLRFHWAVEDLRNYRPIQHIVGYATFLDLRIEVDSHVLIPRPETEQIVAWTIRSLPSPPSSILDLCTGSGCIAIALSKAFPQSQVIGVDVSPEALTLARRNAENLLPPGKDGSALRFLQCDLLHDTDRLPQGKHDLIISNPPYVVPSEKSAIAPNVLQYEPSLALFVPEEDPLIFYRIIARHAHGHLSPEGMLVFEINPLFSREMLKMLEDMGFRPQLHEDFSGRPRFISATL